MLRFSFIVLLFPYFVFVCFVLILSIYTSVMDRLLTLVSEVT